MKTKFNKNGMGLLSLLFAALIIGLIYAYTVNVNKKAGHAKEGYLQQTGLDASSYKNTIDSSKKVLDAAVKSKNDQLQ